MSARLCVGLRASRAAAASVAAATATGCTGGFLPDSEDVSGGVGEERDSERAFGEGRRDDLPSVGGDGRERVVNVGDIDIGA